jgi:hypothetical protein
LIEAADIYPVVPGGPMPEDADERKRWKIRTWTNQVRIQGYQGVDMFGESKKLSNKETKIFNQQTI